MIYFSWLLFVALLLVCLWLGHKVLDWAYYKEEGWSWFVAWFVILGILIPGFFACTINLIDSVITNG